MTANNYACCYELLQISFEVCQWHVDVNPHYYYLWRYCDVDIQSTTNTQCDNVRWSVASISTEELGADISCSLINYVILALNENRLHCTRRGITQD